MSAMCPHESNVIRAANEDRWTSQLRAHLSECEDCMAAVSVAPWMTRFSRISDREHILPDPQLLWLKAQLLRGTNDALRVSRPLTIVQMLAYGTVASGWAAVLTWKWDAVLKWLHSFTPSGMVSTAARADVSMPFFALLFVLASMTVLVGLYTVIAEE
jgi:hypothetical protein